MAAKKPNRPQPPIKDRPKRTERSVVPKTNTNKESNA